MWLLVQCMIYWRIGCLCYTYDAIRLFYRSIFKMYIKEGENDTQNNRIFPNLIKMRKIIKYAFLTTSRFQKR